MTPGPPSRTAERGALVVALAASAVAQGLAGWFTARLVWRERARIPVHTALTLYATQLILTTAWSGLFFGLRDPGAGLVGIAALWPAIGATLVAFWRVRRLAGWLLVPYLAWVSYAASLSWAIWQLNE